MARAIDRRALVSRHNVTRSTLDYRNPMQVGNGRFAFNADITGLQSFVPFACLSDWAWHSFPGEAENVSVYRGREWDFHGRPVMVPDMDPDQPAASAWLDDNPHRQNLGRVGLALRHADGTPGLAAELTDCRQHLDLWTGVLTSQFAFDGAPVEVRTCCHPDIDAVAVTIRSALLQREQASVFFDFPDGDGRYFARQVGDWASPRRHQTTSVATGAGRAEFAREIDELRYPFAVEWSGGARLALPEQPAAARTLRVISARYGDHDVTDWVSRAVRNDTLAFTVDGDVMGRHPREPEVIADLFLDYAIGGDRRELRLPYGAECRLGDDVFRHRHVLAGGSGEWEFVAAFGEQPERLPTVTQTRAASARGWAEFWNTGGAVDFAGSTDSRASELERRIVLSQYVMAVNERGELPSQETGLVNNSWHGKFHFEMYFWHSAHWALWDRWPVLHRTLPIYEKLLPTAIERAAGQGFSGARWPKCTGPEGRESPGEIHSLLVWQQPHVFFFAELDYSAHPTAETLRWWEPILRNTADFLASYLHDDGERLVLGPPVHIVSENSKPAATVNPAFELAYWRFGLGIAQRWRERLNLPREQRWDDVLERLAPLPVEDEVYVIYEGIENMWTDYVFEHPALTGMYGLLPGDGIDLPTMRRTAHRVFTEWTDAKTWGWDFPMLAMCAARLGQPERAVDLLLADSPQFTFTDSGLPTGGPFPYLPSTGALLYAVAMLAAGWPGTEPGSAPGFPDGWVVTSENLRQAL